jgi:hypothetical protein
MFNLDWQELIPSALAYANSRRLVIDFRDRLGDGTDGAVWSTNRGSAVKLFYRIENFRDELECYRRLAGIERVGMLYVPRLVDADDQHLALEMGIIKPPRLLDFGKVHLDAPPPYWDDPHIRARFDSEGRWHFREHWSDVLEALNELEHLGIYYVDPKPGNIVFGDESEDPVWDAEPPLEYESYE